MTQKNLYLLSSKKNTFNQKENWNSRYNLLINYLFQKQKIQNLQIWKNKIWNNWKPDINLINHINDILSSIINLISNKKNIKNLITTFKHLATNYHLISKEHITSSQLTIKNKIIPTDYHTILLLYSSQQNIIYVIEFYFIKNKWQSKLKITFHLKKEIKTLNSYLLNLYQNPLIININKNIKTVTGIFLLIDNQTNKLSEIYRNNLYEKLSAVNPHIKNLKREQNYLFHFKEWDIWEIQDNFQFQWWDITSYITQKKLWITPTDEQLQNQIDPIYQLLRIFEYWHINWKHPSTIINKSLTSYLIRIKKINNEHIFSAFPFANELKPQFDYCTEPLKNIQWKNMHYPNYPYIEGIHIIIFSNNQNIQNQWILNLDINKLVPFIIANGKFPKINTPFPYILNSKLWEKRKWELVGYIPVQVFVPKHVFPFLSVTILRKNQSPLTIRPQGNFQGIYHTYQLEYAENLGCLIKPIWNETAWYTGETQRNSFTQHIRSILITEYFYNKTKIKSTSCLEINASLFKKILIFYYGLLGIKKLPYTKISTNILTKLQQLLQTSKPKNIKFYSKSWWIIHYFKLKKIRELIWKNSHSNYLEELYVINQPISNQNICLPKTVLKKPNLSIIQNYILIVSQWFRITTTLSRTPYPISNPILIDRQLSTTYNAIPEQYWKRQDHIPPINKNLLSLRDQSVPKLTNLISNIFLDYYYIRKNLNFIYNVYVDNLTYTFSSNTDLIAFLKQYKFNFYKLGSPRIINLNKLKQEYKKSTLSYLLTYVPNSIYHWTMELITNNLTIQNLLHRGFHICHLPDHIIQHLGKKIINESNNINWNNNLNIPITDIQNQKTVLMGYQIWENKYNSSQTKHFPKNYLLPGLTNRTNWWPNYENNQNNQINKFYQKNYNKSISSHLTVLITLYEKLKTFHFK